MPTLMLLVGLLTVSPPFPSGFDPDSAATELYCGRAASFALSVASSSGDDDLANAATLIQQVVGMRQSLRLDVPLAEPQLAEDEPQLRAFELALGYLTTRSREVIANELVACAQEL